MKDLVILGKLYDGHTLSIQQRDFRKIFYQHNPSDDWIEPVGGGVSWSIESSMVIRLQRKETICA